MEPDKLSFLPLAALLDEMALQGMRIAPDLQMRLARYLALHGPKPHGAKEWKYRLSALLCYEQSGQEQFYGIFDRVWSAWVEEMAHEEGSESTSSKIPPIPPANISGGIADVPIRPKETAAYVPRPTVGRSGPIRSALSFPANTARFWNTALLDKAMPAWREKEWAPISDWDIEATIKATIKAGGMPSLVSRPRRMTPQYLVLIEEWSPKDHTAGLYADLCAEWRRRDLTVEWFFYDNSPARCWRDRREPSSYTYLERLMGEYEGYKLLLIGEADGLLDLPELRPSTLMVDAVDVFRDVAFLCTRSTAHWGQAERALSQLMPVVPATPEGIASLPRQWTEDIRLSVRHWQCEQPEPSLPQLDREEEESLLLLVSDLKAYLGRNAYLWLCATAVYPELYYELTALLNDESIQPNPSLAEWDQNRVWLNALIRLCRLPWFRRGELPRELREYLREALPSDQARAVRRQLLDVLNRQSAPPSGSYAAADRVFTELWLEHEAALSAVASEEDKGILVDVFREQMSGISAYDIGDMVGRKYFDALVGDTSGLPHRFVVLWVDDNPEKNEGLRDRMSEYLDLDFRIALDTESALRQIQLTPFDVVITDFSRRGEPRAAFQLLSGLRATGRNTRAAVFTSTPIKKQEEGNLLSAGATIIHDSGLELMQWMESLAPAKPKAAAAEPSAGAEAVGWTEFLQDKTRRTLKTLAQRSRNQDIRSLLELAGLEAESYEPILAELTEIWMRKYVDDNQIDRLADQLAELLFGVHRVPADFPIALGALTQTLATEAEAGSEPPAAEPPPAAEEVEPEPAAELENIHRLMATERLGEAISASMSWVSRLNMGGAYQSLQLLQGRYNKNEQDNRLGIASGKEYDRARAQIRYNLLEVLKELEASLGSSQAGAEAPEVVSEASAEANEEILFEVPAEASPEGARKAEPEIAPQSAIPRSGVVVMAAAPEAEARTQAGEEQTQIEDLLAGSGGLSSALVHVSSVADLRDYLSAVGEVQILHFTGLPESSGSGGRFSKMATKARAPQPLRPAGIYLRDSRGQIGLAPPTELALLLGDFKNIQAIVLYACFAESQAEAISRALPEAYVIGVRRLPRDESPFSFARGFYTSLASNRDVYTAIEYGIQQTLAFDEPEDRVIVLRGGSRLTISPGVV